MRHFMGDFAAKCAAIFPAKHLILYMHEHDNWADFRRIDREVALLLDEVTHEQGSGATGGAG